MLFTMIGSLMSSARLWRNRNRGLTAARTRYSKEVARPLPQDMSMFARIDAKSTGGAFCPRGQAYPQAWYTPAPDSFKQFAASLSFNQGLDNGAAPATMNYKFGQPHSYSPFK